jgi:hypothetical protein
LDREIEGSLIEAINLKSEYKVFLGFKPLPEGVTWQGGWERPEMQDVEEVGGNGLGLGGWPVG